MTKALTMFSNNFEHMGESAVDERRRISLGKALDLVKLLYGEEKGLKFAVFTNEIGQILLSPEVSVPAHEVWLYKNPAALAAVAQGLKEANQGKVVNLGSFEKFADDEIE